VAETKGISATAKNPLERAKRVSAVGGVAGPIEWACGSSCLGLGRRFRRSHRPVCVCDRYEASGRGAVTVSSGAWRSSLWSGRASGVRCGDVGPSLRRGAKGQPALPPLAASMGSSARQRRAYASTRHVPDRGREPTCQATDPPPGSATDRKAVAHWLQALVNASLIEFVTDPVVQPILSSQDRPVFASARS